jgi:acyl-CoA carboxylase subunit beta
MTVPHLTVIVGASYGAGGYGMAGRAYDPRRLFAWLVSKTAMMGPSNSPGDVDPARASAKVGGGRPFDEPPTGLCAGTQPRL